MELVKVKIETLDGGVLDWAVAQREALDVKAWVNKKSGSVFVVHADSFRGENPDEGYNGYEEYSPCRGWRDGGQIIENQKIRVTPMPCVGTMWMADHKGCVFMHVSPLVAAMRAYVASGRRFKKYFIEVPQELLP